VEWFGRSGASEYGSGHESCFQERQSHSTHRLTPFLPAKSAVFPRFAP
jgi:hypothetical protein